MRVTNGEAETEDLAYKIGSKLRGGEVIELISDLGGGKTTFVRGLAKGAGSPSHVSSPTFTISKLYKARHFQIMHFDLYRLQEVGLIEHELVDNMNEETVIVIEWGDSISHILPENRLRVSLSIVGEGVRRIKLESPELLNYLLGDF